jgi:hypothetical protein
MRLAVEKALEQLNRLISEGKEYPEAFDIASRKLGVKACNELKQAYLDQE